MSLAAAARWLPAVNASLNAIATVLLVYGWVAIRRGNVRAHRTAMVAAFGVSTLFLACYLSYHAVVGHVPFAGRGAARPVYFAILISHILLAVAVPVLAVSMFALAWRGRFETHRRLGRIALPIWLYVSVTGVVIFLMLYHLFPPAGPAPVAAVVAPATSNPHHLPRNGPAVPNSTPAWEPHAAGEMTLSAPRPSL